jgi:hypothetical protein
MDANRWAAGELHLVPIARVADVVAANLHSSGTRTCRPAMQQLHIIQGVDFAALPSALDRVVLPRVLGSMSKAWCEREPL